MALLDDIRLALRITTSDFDSEIEDSIQAAISEMRRCGVREELLKEKTMSPLVKNAIKAFCRADVGMDISEADRFNRSFNQTIINLMNSSKNECAGDEE